MKFRRALKVVFVTAEIMFAILITVIAFALVINWLGVYILVVAPVVALTLIIGKAVHDGLLE